MILHPPTQDSHRVHPKRSVTREMLHARTMELALMAGRAPHEIKQVDYERAKYELTGESDFDRQQALLENLRG